jgi:hypothetical protein
VSATPTFFYGADCLPISAERVIRHTTPRDSLATTLRCPTSLVELVSMRSGALPTRAMVATPWDQEKVICREIDKWKRYGAFAPATRMLSVNQARYGSA